MSSIHSIGSMNQLADAFDKAGLGSDFATKLRQYNLSMINDVLCGRAEITYKKHQIDCCKEPSSFEDYNVIRHETDLGIWEWDPNRVSLYYNQEWQKPVDENNFAMNLELANRRDVLNGNILDYLLKNPLLIPDSWKERETIFSGTAYENVYWKGKVCFRMLLWSHTDKKWMWNWLWMEQDRAVKAISYDGYEMAVALAS